MEAVREQPEPAIETESSAPAVVVIGAGTGGIAALIEILPRMPADFPAGIIVVQQMRPGFTRILAEDLQEMSEIDVKEAVDGQPVRSGAAIVTPGGKTLKIMKTEGRGVRVRIEHIEDAEKARARLDTTMNSAAQVYGARAMGVVLTGMGEEGRNGLKSMRDRGGKTIAQDEMSSVIFDMPRAAIRANVVDEVVPLWSITDRLIDLIGEVHGSFLPEAAG